EEYISSDEAEVLIDKIFDTQQQHSGDELGRLFRFARSRYRIDLIRRLHEEARYGPAKQHLGEYQKAQLDLVPSVRNGNKKNLDRTFSRFGVNITEPQEGMTALMLAIQYGKDSLTETLLEEGASVNNTDRLNRTALQHLILGFDRRQVKVHLLNK
ncbi:MAG: ankyrin repeat domain-containing protein, partial [Saprospiraceae bacterium]